MEEEYDDESFIEEDTYQIVRAKWIMDGAKTLKEAAIMVDGFASYLRQLDREGYQLIREIEDDYGFIQEPE